MKNGQAREVNFVGATPVQAMGDDDKKPGDGDNKPWFQFPELVAPQWMKDYAWQIAEYFEGDDEYARVYARRSWYRSSWERFLGVEQRRVEKAFNRRRAAPVRARLSFVGVIKPSDT
jgi:hypothetical protein